MRQRAAWILIPMMAACAAESVPEAATIELGAPVRERVASLSDTVPPFFQFLFDAVVWKDSLAIADMSDASVHLLPRNLEGGRSIGTRGEGPTEFGSPQSVAALGDTLVVFDRANARIAWVGPSGQVADSRQLMIPSIEPGFAPLGSRGILYPSADPALYAEASTAGERLDPIRRPTESTSSQPLPSTTLVPHESGPVVVDMLTAEVIFVGVDAGSPLTPPVDLFTQLEARVAEFPPEAVPTLILRAGEAPQGVVVWFPFDIGTVGAIVSPEGEWQLLTSQTPIEYPLGVLVWDDELILLHQDGVRAYSLQ